MKQITHIFLIMLLIASGCKKEEDVLTTTNTTTFTPTLMTNVKGIVLDENQNPISGVTVNIGNSNSTSSSDNGLFTFNDISVPERAMIYFEKSGYFNTSRACEVNNHVSNYLRIVMDEKQINGTFSSNSGSNLMLNNGISLNLPSNSYTYSDGSTYYGDINVSVNKISPEGPNFSMRIPGGDLRATRTNGDDRRLYSYGMIDVVLTGDNGESINTTPGSNTQIRMPIADNMLADAPNEIPLWHYDDLTGIWVEEGIATKSGNEYIGNVSHFSYWNWDVPTQEAGVYGTVLDCEGSPMANVLVIIGQQSVSTNSSGEFNTLVPSGQNFLIEVSDNFGNTTSIPVSALSAMSEYDAGDITICSSVIEGNVVDCNGNPAQNILISSPYSAFTYGYSDINGNFSFFFPDGIASTISAEGFSNTTSSYVVIPQLSNNQVYNAGTISICGPGGSTTVAQDKQDVSNTFASMENCISSLKNGYGAEALQNFLNLDEGDVLSENWIEDMVENIDDLLNLNTIDDNNRFDFNGNTGTYTWSQSAQSWSQTSIPSNKIIIRFPSSEGTSINDAEFTFHSYNDIALFYDGESIYAPTSLNADLYVTGTKVFELNGNYTYDVGNPTPIPININTAFTFNPFTITITGQRITSTEFEADLSITNNSGCLTSLHVDAEFAHDDYENLENTDIIEVNTTMSHDNMSIVGFVDGALIAIDDPSNTQINNMSDIDMYYSGNKIGELILQQDSNGDENIYIRYSDSSVEHTEVYYDPFLTNMEQILFPFLGDWD